VEERVVQLVAQMREGVIDQLLPGVYVEALELVVDVVEEMDVGLEIGELEPNR
jgi:hypothetical protein